MIPTGQTNFWKAQIIGWGFVSVSNFLIQSSIPKIATSQLLFNSIIPMLVGVLLTTAFRFFVYKKDWKHWSWGRMLGLIIGSTFLLTIGLLIIVFPVQMLLNQEKEVSFLIVMASGVNFFILFFIWTIIYFGIHYFNHWNQAEIDKWKLVAEMKEAQLDALKSQINPHFVFNALNNIRSLILEDKEKAREMLFNFSDLFRYSLQSTNQTQVTLDEELQMVNQYFDLLSIQYEDKLTYNISMDDGLEEVKIPPMMLQLLVENAVKHGISQFREGGVIIIDIDKLEHEVNINVKNTGNLKTSASIGDKLGVGLANIRKRLDLLYNGKAQLQLKEVNEFVEATIKIPLI